MKMIELKEIDIINHEEIIKWVNHIYSSLSIAHDVLSDFCNTDLDVDNENFASVSIALHLLKSLSNEIDAAFNLKQNFSPLFNLQEEIIVRRKRNA